MADFRTASSGGCCSPVEKNGVHEFFFMCDNVKAFIAEVKNIELLAIQSKIAVMAYSLD